MPPVPYINAISPSANVSVAASQRPHHSKPRQRKSHIYQPHYPRYPQEPTDSHYYRAPLRHFRSLPSAAKAMSFTPRFPPPPPYSLLPGETERTLSADTAPPPPPYRPLPRVATSHTVHEQSAEQVVIWLRSKPVFAPWEYENVLIILWHEMVQRRLDEILATASGPESSFWEDMLVEVESERDLRLVTRCCIGSDAFSWISRGTGRGARGVCEGVYILQGVGVFMPHSSCVEDYQTHLFSFRSGKYAVPNDARVREPVLHYLSKDLPLWDVFRNISSWVSSQITYRKWQEPSSASVHTTMLARELCEKIIRPIFQKESDPPDLSEIFSGGRKRGVLTTLKPVGSTQWYSHLYTVPFDICVGGGSVWGAAGRGGGADSIRWSRITQNSDSVVNRYYLNI
ncbi:unnamed protein product [Tuber melanosporum]|uniref:(Perigord truffle) hypothetical protein n=1 Tax=Tuber melanosporum (strain Mel28) TaxID=656061 RepID=D5G574_TUBMM|nr:uncharacterized protein GSTUM_00000339001 [Tuber melanosporum]CAZ79667.1 unnamed protein product [Tuber melanosporum]